MKSGTGNKEKPPGDTRTVEQRYAGHERGDGLKLLRTALRDTGIAQKSFCDKQKAMLKQGEFDNLRNPVNLSVAGFSLYIINGVIPKAMPKGQYDTMILRVAKQFDAITGWLHARNLKPAELLKKDDTEQLDKKGHAHKIGGGGDAMKARANRCIGLNGEIFMHMEAQMLKDFTVENFRLKADPFDDDLLTPENVFQTKSMKDAHSTMMNASKKGGLVAIIAAVGAGKTVTR